MQNLTEDELLNWMRSNIDLDAEFRSGRKQDEVGRG